MFAAARRMNITSLVIDNRKTSGTWFDEDPTVYHWVERVERSNAVRKRSHAFVRELARTSSLESLTLFNVPIYPNDGKRFADIVARSNIKPLVLSDDCFDDVGWDATMAAIPASKVTELVLHVARPLSVSHPFSFPHLSKSKRLEYVHFHVNESAWLTLSDASPALCEIMAKGSPRNISLSYDHMYDELYRGPFAPVSAWSIKTVDALAAAFALSRTAETFGPGVFSITHALELRRACRALTDGTSVLCRLPSEVKRSVCALLSWEGVVNAMFAGGS